MEGIACTYGYPLDKGDVSHLHDMSHVFKSRQTYNEYIGSWDVSGVTKMREMFGDATYFNHDIGSWGVSCVSIVREMFKLQHLLTKTLVLGMCPV
jgi:hypothetical protein